MKKLLTLLSCVFFIFTVSAKDEMVIPKGVNYKKTSDKINNQAKKILQKLLSGKISNKEAISYFENNLICGPSLWDKIKKDKEIEKLNLAEIKCHVPIFNNAGNIKKNLTFDARLFQTSEEILHFWKAFMAQTDFSDFKIRKLNTTELKLYWAMIPFDITEPLFIIESKNQKILVNFVTQKALKIMWIDDFQNNDFYKKKFKAN